MRKVKHLIIFTLVFMVIGYATISISLGINGNASVISDASDFRIYFSNILVNGTQDLSLVKSDRELNFNINLEKLGVEHEITYEITNASSVFDAALNVNCTQGNDVLSVINQLDTSSNLLAKSTRTGTLTLKKSQSNISEYDNLYSISCTITASPISRSDQASGSVTEPLPAYKYSVGTEINVGTEKFNVVSYDTDNVVMLAQYNLGRDYKQSTTFNNMSFDGSGWGSEQEPKEVNIQQQTTNIKAAINNYVLFLESETGDENITGDLMSLNDLKKLGCTVPDNYYLNLNNSPSTTAYNCNNSPYSSTLINGQSIWTKSVNSYSSQEIWYLGQYGELSTGNKTGLSGGIRPVITISKETLEKTIIKFSIDGTEYKAEEGMTWEEWLDSSYNVDNYISFESEIYDEYEDYMVVNSDYTYTHTTDLIINNHSYLLYVYCCFDAGSKVLMADGTLKNIEEVEIGDLVMSLNEDTGEYVAQRVSSTIINKKSTDLVYIYLSNGTRIGMRAYHPLLTTEGWKSLRPDSPDAKRENIEGLSLLEVGDTLVGYDENITIVKVEQRPEVEDYYTYNLGVEGHHNYIVEGIVVHNGSKCDQ